MSHMTSLMYNLLRRRFLKKTTLFLLSHLRPHPVGCHTVCFPFHFLRASQRHLPFSKLSHHKMMWKFIAAHLFTHLQFFLKLQVFKCFINPMMLHQRAQILKAYRGCIWTSKSLLCTYYLPGGILEIREINMVIKCNTCLRKISSRWR